MLRLINVCKSYKYGKNKFAVLDNVNLDFKKREMVFILGNSGSGKSTLLNIVGGILDVDSGKVMLDDKDITKFNKNMLCNYRNNMIGFIFQDYHLIEYMSAIDNIKLGMTIKNNNSNYIDDMLNKLGIYHKKYTKVNKLSGGEKQRVAIARALVNNPDIILCDEPTGALDRVNGVKVMDILKEISKDKLVIVVSHDNILASKYADRVINISDGKVDYYPQIDMDKFNDIKKKKIGLWKLIKLAIKNLGLKKGRTFLTSLAVSIGFVCMLMVLCLYKSFSSDLSVLEKDIVSKFPISIYNGDFEMTDYDVKTSDNMIVKKDKVNYIHANKINQYYLDYINNIDEIEYVSYSYDISMPLISDRYKLLDNDYMRMVPSNEFIDNNYDILYGNNISNMNEIILKIDGDNNVSSELLDVFNINKDINYEDIIGRKIKVILNDLYYIENSGYYYINDDYYELYRNSNIELKIVGVVREKETTLNESYFYFDKSLIDYVIGINKDSEIVIDQINNDNNILGIDMDKNDLLAYLGYETLPNKIDIYVNDIDDKNIVLEKLDDYNKKYDKLIYIDGMKDAIDIFKSIINVVTVVLTVFSLISMIVSSLMIFILTNNRVMERVKEIGILRAVGAKASDITRLFNIENLIIGIISSLLGMIFVVIVKEPINIIMENLMIGNDIFKIYIDLVIVSILFNIFIVVMSGYIPSRIASKKKIVDCIYNRF